MRPSLVASVPLFFWLTALVASSLYAQISDSPGSVNCPPTVNLTLTVTTEDGAVISNALVILREDTLGQPRGVKVLKLELRTDEVGKATAAVPCNYLDVFVAHNGFAPAAQKFLITKDAHTFTVPLKMYGITRTTEVAAIEPEVVSESRNPTKLESFVTFVIVAVDGDSQAFRVAYKKLVPFSFDHDPPNPIVVAYVTMSRTRFHDYLATQIGVSGPVPDIVILSSPDQAHLSPFVKRESENARDACGGPNPCPAFIGSWVGNERLDPVQQVFRALTAQ